MVHSHKSRDKRIGDEMVLKVGYLSSLPVVSCSAPGRAPHVSDPSHSKLFSRVRLNLKDVQVQEGGVIINVR